MGFVNRVLQSSLKTILVCFQMSLETSVEMGIYIGLIIAILTANLRTANLNTGNLHRFVNYDFNSDFKNCRFKIR